jgi:hypothetical protein
MWLSQSTPPVISRLEDTLRARTVALTRHTEYSPWLSLAAAGMASPSREELQALQHKRGQLQTDEGYLARLSEFFAGTGRPVFDDIYTERVGLLESGDRVELFVDIISEMPEAEVWFSEALEMVRWDPVFSKLYDTVVEAVIPTKVNFEAMGMSSHYARGVIFLAFSPAPESPFMVALDLAHELAHQALMVYESADPLIREGDTGWTYSAVRGTQRPPDSAFHGAAALSHMLHWVRLARERSGEIPNPVPSPGYLTDAESRFADGLAVTIRELRSQCDLTALGDRLLSAMESGLHRPPAGPDGGRD